MNFLKLRSVISLTVIILTVLQTGCSSSSPTSASTLASSQTQTVTLGMSYSVTGANATPSTNGWQGVNAMVNWVNSNGGVLLSNGQHVMFSMMNAGDDASNTSTVQTLYTQLANNPAVNFLVGPYGTAASAIANPIAESTQKLILSAYGADDSLFQNNSSWRVQVIPKASEFLNTTVDLLAGIAARQNGPLKIALTSENDPFSKSVLGGVKAEIATHGTTFQVVSDSTSSGYYPGGLTNTAANQTTMNAFVAGVQPLKSDQNLLIINTGHNTDGILYTKALQAAGIQPSALALTVAPASNSFYAAIPNSYARGVMSSVAWTDSQEIYSTTNVPSGFEFYGPDQATCVSFIHQQNGNTVPSYHAALGGMAVLALAKAIEVAGTTDPTTVSKAIRQLQMQTCFGQYEVDANTGLQTAWKMLTVQWQTSADNQTLAAPTLRVVEVPASIQAATSTLIFPKP